MEYKDYYEIMGVARDATQDEIKRTYRKLARKYHPDVSKESDAEARFKELGEAYEVLKDPEKRVAYDELGKEWKSGQDFRPPPDWDAGFEFRGGGDKAHAGGASQRFLRGTVRPWLCAPWRCGRPARLPYARGRPSRQGAYRSR